MKAKINKVAKINTSIARPTDAKWYLTETERNTLPLVSKYRWMITIDPSSGTLYQLQPAEGQSKTSNIATWKWQPLSTGLGGDSVLIQDLQVFEGLHGIPNNQLFEKGTTLENVLRTLLIKGRDVIYPNFTFARHNTNALVETNSTFNASVRMSNFQLGDSEGWEAGTIFFKIGEEELTRTQSGGTFTASKLITNITSPVTFTGSRSYLGKTAVPPMNADLSSGTITKNITINHRLPYFIGNSIYPVSPEDIQAILDNKVITFTSHDIRKKLISPPPNRLFIDDGFWRENEHYTGDNKRRYLFILIPMEWNKVLDSYYHNGGDNGSIVGSAWSIREEVTLNKPYNSDSNWMNKNYRLYAIGHKTELQDTTSNPFYFDLI